MATPHQQPEWIELPPNGGKCPIFGLPLTTMRRLTCPSAWNKMRPPVRSKLVKYPGAKRGRRMVEVASMREFLAALPDEEVAS